MISFAKYKQRAMRIQIKEFKFNIGNKEVFMEKEPLEWDFEGELSSEG